MAAAATETSSRAAAGSSSSADSYIGSLISLTSKYEIRYEGVLFNINTEESSIGLRHVRSFGTEGRKKYGPQIPPSDKVYDYILFRGSDIKDLQVKSSPPPQATATIHNDPAIIQSHYSRPAAISTSLPSVGSGTMPDVSSHTSQLGLPRSTFQAGLPLYQPAPGDNLGSWGSSPAPPSANASALPMPMYWQGFYGPSTGLPQLQQPPLLRPGGPSPGLPIPNSMQQPMQYPSLNSSLSTGALSLSEFPSPLLPPISSASNLTSTTLPSTLLPVQAAALASDLSLSLVASKVPATSLPLSTSSSNLPSVSPLISSSLDLNSTVAPVSSMRSVPGPTLPYPAISHSMPDISGPSTSSQSETSVPPLITPDQLLQAGPSNLSLSQPPLAGKDVEVVRPAPSESSISARADSKEEPLLPLPKPTNMKMNEGNSQGRYCNSTRGRERGRGNGIPRNVTKFTEDFDFIAMNEKFNKDEVWGHLGKSKGQSGDKEVANGDADDTHDDDDVGLSNCKAKPVYVKDEFFDSLSCNSLDDGPRNGRTRFSEQMKLDTETFGEFSRYHGRGGRGSGRGGRSRGGYYGRGYGYGGRGRGQTYYNHPR